MSSVQEEAVGLEQVNEIRLAGRVSQTPVERVMPSGDRMWAFRVVVRRPETQVQSRQPVDALDCVVWSPRMRRIVARWREGDFVQVEGALRRRFLRGTAGGAVSRHEVEVFTGRRVRRAPDA